VGSQIAEHFPDTPSLQKTKKLLLENVESLLSYNDSIFQDGDSTTFILNLTQQLNLPNQDIKTNWFNYLHDSGGWQTYIHEKPLRERLELPEDVSVTAWLSPKVCVSAAAATILKEIDPSAFNKTAAYLVKNINSSGYWESYWWTSPVYATAHSIMALANITEQKITCENACNWLLTQQQPDGSWLNQNWDVSQINRQLLIVLTFYVLVFRLSSQYLIKAFRSWRKRATPETTG
jgi:squalene cyclase